VPARQKERTATTGLDPRRLYAAIDHERKLRDMTLEELASELDVSYPTLCCWRRGDDGMRADVALRISLFLSADLRRFARQIDPSPRSQMEAA
jgi:transcriptional regulator with XRE-family HTH domain